MKTVEFELNGRVHHLLLNGAALFDAYDKFGDKGSLLDHMTGTGRESFDNTVWFLVKLAQQGEAARRFQGEEAAPMLTAEEAVRMLRPVDVLRAQAAVREAWALGFARETVPEEETIDLGLMELQKKRNRTHPGKVAQHHDPVSGPLCSGGHDAGTGAGDRPDGPGDRPTGTETGGVTHGNKSDLHQHQAGWGGGIQEAAQ